MDHVRLREVLTTYFNVEELHTLCFDLSIDFEDLGVKGKQAKAREIVDYCRRTDQIRRLVMAIHRFRPHLDLPGDVQGGSIFPARQGRQGKGDEVISPPAVARPVNLSFEAYALDGWPSGWFDSHDFVSGVSTRYRARVIKRPEGNGMCTMFWNMEAGESEFGSLMQRCPAEYVAGRAVRVEGEIRTRDVEQWAGLWIRADGEAVPDLVFDNMSGRPIRGTTPWRRYAIDVQLPQETAWLNYGIVLVGSGVIWADNFRVMVWASTGRWEDV